LGIGLRVSRGLDLQEEFLIDGELALSKILKIKDLKSRKNSHSLPKRIRLRSRKKRPEIKDLSGLTKAAEKLSNSSNHLL